VEGSLRSDDGSAEDPATSSSAAAADEPAESNDGSRKRKAQEVDNGPTDAEGGEEPSSLANGDAGSAAGNVGPGSAPPLRRERSLKHVPCRFFREDRCSAGDVCRFSHEVFAEDASASWGSSNGRWSNSEWIPEDALQTGDRADLLQWRTCSKIGTALPGTFVIPVKTPLEGWLEDLGRKEGVLTPEDSFNRLDLVELCKANGTPLGLVIDLVNTDKYYRGYFPGDGVEYRKMRVPGRQAPTQKETTPILDAIDDYLERRPSKDLHVAIHCTHGVNRTGFFAAVYLLMRTRAGQTMTSAEARGAFEQARGERMDKDYLIETLDKIVSARP